MLQEIGDLVCCKLLRIEHQLYAHLLEKQTVLRSEEFIVINPRGDFPGSEVLGEQGTDDVDLLGDEGDHRNEQVRVLDTGIPHHAE